MVKLSKKLTKNTAIYTKINPSLWETIEEYIKSTLEDSGFCQKFTEENPSALSIVVVFSGSGGDRLSAYKALEAAYKASQFTLLPSEDLKSLVYTQDLEDEWKWQRFWSLLLAKCFLLISLNEVENQLEEEKKASIITKWDAELIELTASRYEALYRLIKKGFKYLRKSLPTDLASQKSWDIFMEVCREEIDAPFVARTSSFQEILIDKYLPKWKELTEHNTSRNNFKCLLETQYLFNSELLFAVIESLTEKQREITS
ncbi:MAG: hypothetical protein M3O33_23380 [Cyanobacteriota bacterium]|nr:hypothetical protein [Cyanobacteriota bacterium]